MKGPGDMEILLDPEDEHLRDLGWSVYCFGDDLYYACRNSGEGTRYLHRVIMGDPTGFEVDHRNGNGLDNRRANLRVTSHRLNIANQRTQIRPKSSKYKGVSWYRTRERWQAYIKVNGRKWNLGYFMTEEEAAHAYDRAALMAWGEFARPNFGGEASA